MHSYIVIREQDQRRGRLSHAYVPCTALTRMRLPDTPHLKVRCQSVGSDHLGGAVARAVIYNHNLAGHVRRVRGKRRQTPIQAIGLVPRRHDHNGTGISWHQYIRCNASRR